LRSQQQGCLDLAKRDRTVALHSLTAPAGRLPGAAGRWSAGAITSPVSPIRQDRAGAEPPAVPDRLRVGEYKLLLALYDRTLIEEALTRCRGRAR
jgi:hypothetical protein